MFQDASWLVSSGVLFWTRKTSLSDCNNMAGPCVGVAMKDCGCGCENPSPPPAGVFNGDQLNLPPPPNSRIADNTVEPSGCGKMSVFIR